MHLSNLIEIKGNIEAVRTTGVEREDWAVSLRLGSASNCVYISYEQAKSLWFSLNAALSEIEDVKAERYCLETIWSEEDVRALCTLPLGHTGDHKVAE